MADDDMTLVREYAATRNEQAFETLVSRHVNLVYSVALRLVREPHLAEEVAQTVFIILARKAGSLRDQTILSGWLCRTARFAAGNLLTVQRRRQEREQEAHMQSLGNESDAEAWKQIAPLLDAALAQLGEADHNAIVLRFFEGRTFQDVGQTLGTSEDAAKKRVTRAIEKLRRIFQKRGVALSTTAIAGAVSAHSVQAAPVGLAAAITATAVHGTATTASIPTLTKTTLKLMAYTKTKIAVTVGILVALAATTSVILTQRNSNSAPTPLLAFAGYATPEAAIQSSIWAASTGDFKKFIESCTPDQVAQFNRRMPGKSDDEMRRGAIAWAKAVAGYKITQKEVVAEDEVHLHISAPPSQEGLRNGRVILIMRKIGSDWKQAGPRD